MEFIFERNFYLQPTSCSQRWLQFSETKNTWD